MRWYVLKIWNKIFKNCNKDYVTLSRYFNAYLFFKLL